MTSARHVVPEPSKTYASQENAIKAVEKVFTRAATFGESACRYLVIQHTDGRWFPVFVGEPSLTALAHFHFNVVN